MKGIAFFLIFILAAVCVKAQKDTTYFYFKGSIKQTAAVASDTLNYSIHKTTRWMEIKVYTPYANTHILVHNLSLDHYTTQILDLNKIPHEKLVKLSSLTSLTGRQFIDRFGYLQYGHVYYLIPLLDKDDRGYKAYEFTFESNFLNVE